MSYLIYFSKTGNTEELAKTVITEKYKPTKIFKLPNEYPSVQHRTTILGTPTYGNGSVPKVVKEFISKYDWNNVNNLILFGSGLTQYPKFCGALDRIENVLLDKFAPYLTITKIKFDLLTEV